MVMEDWMQRNFQAGFFSFYNGIKIKPPAGENYISILLQKDQYFNKAFTFVKLKDIFFNLRKGFSIKNQLKIAKGITNK